MVHVLVTIQTSSEYKHSSEKESQIPKITVYLLKKKINLGEPSVKLSKELKCLNYSPVFYPVTKVAQLSTVKDSTPDNRKAGIYAVQCGGAGCEAIYIGQTGRRLQEREREHTSTTRKSDPGDSAVRKH